MRRICHVERAHEPAIIPALHVFVVYDKLASLMLGKSAYCRRGMQSLYQIAYIRIGCKTETKVATQMHKVAGAHGSWSFLANVICELQQAILNISCYIMLLLNVLCAPRYLCLNSTILWRIKIQLRTFQPHGTGKGHRLPFAP